MSEGEVARDNLDSETEITLGVLSAVQENSAVTQRSVAKQLGIALGLTNAYLKRCIDKGLIKVQQIPPNRYAYYLTPQGFAEKTRLTAEYLSHSFHFFRRARSQCSALLQDCTARGWRRVALCGHGELSEIALYCARDLGMELAGLVDAAAGQKRWHGLPVAADLAALGAVDAVIVTDVNAPQDCFEAMCAALPAERVLTPALLRVAREVPAEGAGE